MLSDFGLIHMNARVYDPVTGRFLSADRVVQDVGNSQSYNRYSYCINNPVNATDPTGNEYDSAWFDYINDFINECADRLERYQEAKKQQANQQASTGQPPAAQNAGAAGSNNANGASSQSQSLLNQNSPPPSGTVGLKAGNAQTTPGTPNRAGVDPTVVTTSPVQTVGLPGVGTIVVNRYNGGAGKKGSTATLDFDFNHNGNKDAYGVLQTVTVDTFSKNKTPYADAAPGTKYYDDGITSVPRPDIENPVYDLKTEKMVPGLLMLPSRTDGVLRFHDTPQNPISITPLYGSLSFQTVIVMRGSDTPVATMTWGYTNQESGYVLQPLVITPTKKTP